MQNVLPSIKRDGIPKHILHSINRELDLHGTKVQVHSLVRIVDVHELKGESHSYTEVTRDKRA
jgi:hypothetical protein